MPEPTYSQQIYDYLCTLDKGYKNDVPFADFENSMQDKAYASSIYSWIDSRDKSFKNDVSENDFYEALKKKDNLPYGSNISTSPLDIAEKTVNPVETFEFGVTAKKPKSVAPKPFTNEVKPIGEEKFIGSPSVWGQKQQGPKAIAYEADIPVDPNNPEKFLGKKQEPKPSQEKVKQAYELSSTGQYDESNVVIEQEISANPNNTYLLELQSYNQTNQAADLFSQGKFTEAQNLLVNAKQNIDAANALSKQQGKPLNISTYIDGAELSLAQGDKKAAKGFIQPALYANNGQVTDDQTDIQIAKAYEIAANISDNKEQQERFTQYSKSRMSMAKQKQDDENYKGWVKYLRDPNFSLHLMENIVNPTGEMRGIYEGVKRVGEGMIESTAGVIDLASGLSGEASTNNEEFSLKQFGKQQLKAALDITIGAAHTYFSASMLMQWGTAPIVPASFTIAGALAPGLTEKIMSPATTIARDVYGTDIENLSDTQKGFLELGDIIGMIVLLEGAKHSSKFVGKKISEIPIGDQTLIGKLGAVSQKIFNKEPLTESEIETTNETLKNTTDETIVEATKATIVSKDQAATGKIEVSKEEVKPVETKPVETTGGEKVEGNDIKISDEDIKQKQFDIITETNPPKDDIHTAIRSKEEILTPEEAFKDDSETPDWGKKEKDEALYLGVVKIYSSKPIENGAFVTPSEMEAKNYAGNGKVYSKEVSVKDVAWIDGLQGQYAKIEKIKTEPTVKVAEPVAETPKTENVVPEALKDVENFIPTKETTFDEWKQNATVVENIPVSRTRNRAIYELNDKITLIEDEVFPHNFMKEPFTESRLDLQIEATKENKELLKKYNGELDEEFGYTGAGYGLPFFKTTEDAFNFAKEQGKKYSNEEFFKELPPANAIPATTKVEPVKPVVESPTENPLSQFETIVKESKSLDEAFTKSTQVKDIPLQNSKAFREKYDPENNLTPKQAFEKFYNEVKGEKGETPKEVSKQNIDKFKEQMASGFEGIMDKIGGKKNITSAERTTLITDLKNIANGFIGLTFEEMRTALYEVVNKLKLKYRLKDKDVDEIVHGALEDFIVKDEATARTEVAKTLESNYANIEKKVFGTSTKTNKDFKGKTSIINRLLALPQKAQEATFAKLYDFVGDKLAKVLAKGMGNKYSLIRSATKTTDSLFKNIVRQRKDVTSQADFIGAKNRAVEDTIKIDYILKKLLGDNAKESSERIIKVLDPEFYKKLEKDEFENEMRNEFTDKLVDERLAIEPDFLDKKYNEYLDEFGFNDPNYKDITFDDLNPTEQAVYQILKEINSFLHDVNFSVNKKISYKTYLINKDKYFGRLYDKFDMPEDVQKELNDIGNKMFDDLYKERGDITTWKRSHRIQDPIYTTTKRLYQTQMNKAFTEYFDYVSKNPEYVSDVPRSGYITLKGESYGELNGKHVRADVVEDIRGVFYTNDIIQKMHELFSKYNQIAPRRWYRKLFTVYNPGVHVGNFTGNIVFSSWLGINPVRFLKDFTLAGKEIKNYGDTYRYLIKRGVLSSDLTIEDLGTSLKKLNDLFEESSTKKNPLRWLSDKATTVYRATDDLAKVAAFKSLTDMGFSPDTAIERISQGFQNYKRVGKAYDFFSKVPAVGNMYAKFAGDLQRILRTGIMTRPLNFVAFGAALHAIANVASSMSGESDEDRKIREERPGFPKIKLPDWLGGDIPLSFKMGQNELNLARFISPLYVYSSPDNDDVYNTFMKMSPQKIDITDWTSNPNGIIAVNIAKNLQDPLLAPILQTIVNSDFKGTPIADPNETIYKKSNLTDQERTVNSLRFLARSYLPYGSYADDGLRAIAGQQDYYGRDRTLSQIILRFVGYNAQQFKDDRYNKIVENDLINKAYRIVDNAKILRSIEKDYINKEATEEQYKKRYAEKIEQQAILMSELKDAIKKALPRLKKEGIDTLLEDKDFKVYFKEEDGEEYKYQHQKEYRGKLPEDEKQPSQINEIK